jgi:formylglycine-generating enzyme required for sulfatase activity
MPMPTLLRFAAFLLTLFALGCKEAPAPKGQLMVVVSTDLAPPKDFDEVRLVVAYKGESKLDTTYSLRGQAAIKLPATIAVNAGSETATPVDVRVEARLRGKVVAVRDARTTVPTDRSALLSMPIEFLCVGQITAAGEPLCNAESTCVGGSCGPRVADASALPTYDPSGVFGGAPAPGAGGRCFDVLDCFGESTPQAPDASCTLPVPADRGAGLNVALLNPERSQGICASNACLVVLENDAARGWVEANGRIQLPAAACARTSRVLASTTCATKRASDPPCGSWSSSGTVATDGTLVEVNLGDAGVPVVDAGVADGGADDAGPGDAGTQDSGPPNPCAANNGGCSALATCTVGDAGAPVCTCRPGYTGDGFGCIDVNECLTANGGCATDATCTNTPGSRTCACTTGYQGDGVTCTDLDECATQNGGCSANAACSNRPGFRTCACNSGYAGDGLTCADVNECATANGGCDANATCTNTQGSRTCACNAGYEGSGVVCTDVNECATANGGCALYALCTNTAGSRTCTCQPGFTGDGVTCANVDECAANSSLCGPAAAGTCTDTPGGYTCTCRPGYTLQGGVCVDINECATANGGCSANATCTNTQGSRTCACNSGWSGDGVTCANIDECSANPGICGPPIAGYCVDTPGAFACSCRSGYSLVNGVCTEVDVCAGTAPCVAETDQAFCTRMSAVCGARTGLDNCGRSRSVAFCGACTSPGELCSDATNQCRSLTPGSEVSATTASLLGDGLSNCGVNRNENCGRSLGIPGGTFYRGDGTAAPATISNFQLDKFEVTVGRFRQFAEAWAAGWRPSPGQAKHRHLRGGQGLTNAAITGGFEAGWLPDWSERVGEGANSTASWTTALSCNPNAQTWTPTPSINERLPINCVSWFDAAAFCLWDGGFLPSEAEWEFGAAGGPEERLYPWGQAAADQTRAVMSSDAPAAVGERASGDGRWGHSDLAGNVWEWTIDASDGSVTFPSPCTDCTQLYANTVSRYARGGSYSYGGASQVSATRSAINPGTRSAAGGVRCARTTAPVGCTPESDAAFCARLAASCGTKTSIDNCGSPRSVWNCGNCSAGLVCRDASNSCVSSLGGELSATTAVLTGPGLSTCGPAGNDNCARSLLVPSGSFFRGSDTSLPATVSSFRLDKYEVTVGRFRKFVDAWVNSKWRPSSGFGRHTHLNGGKGLTDGTCSYEDGWLSSWTSVVGAPQNSQSGAVTLGDWTNSLALAPMSYDRGNWSETPGGNESNPISALSWYDLYAFCIWDGGFLPSEVEWEYAASGGSDERTYPWGESAPTQTLAVFGANTLWETSRPVGSVPAGDGRWGHSDLSGNRGEWVFDTSFPTASPCANCASFGTGSSFGRSARGSSSGLPASQSERLQAAYRQSLAPSTRENFVAGGGRCARVP